MGEDATRTSRVSSSELWNERPNKSTLPRFDTVNRGCDFLSIWHVLAERNFENVGAFGVVFLETQSTIQHV